MRYLRKNRQTGTDTCTGFTLIEVMVVISLTCIVFFFFLPRFQNPFQPDDTKTASRWIMLKVKSLKEKSVHEQKHNLLHINLDSNRMWTTEGSMPEKELREAEEKSYRLPESIRVIDVEFPGENQVSTGTAIIAFYKRGYSDYAIIHLENSDRKQLSFIIEPFMPGVSFHDKYVNLVN